MKVRANFLSHPCPITSPAHRRTPHSWHRSVSMSPRQTLRHPQLLLWKWWPVDVWRGAGVSRRYLINIIKHSIYSICFNISQHAPSFNF